MMNRILNVRVVAAALAASALVTAPAAADPATGISARLDIQPVRDSRLLVSVAHRGHTVRGLNAWGQTRREADRLRRAALQQCRAEIGRIARRNGFRDVDFDDDRRIRQTGPHEFRILFDEVEFERRRREIERDVTCVVRRGNVVRLDGVPQPGHAPVRPYRGR